MLTRRLLHLGAAATRAVEVRLPEDATVGDLLVALGEEATATLHTPSGPLDPDLAVRDAALLDGDAVTTRSDMRPADPGAPLVPPPGSPLALAVVGGPDAGRWIGIAPTARSAGITVGRGPGADLVLRDPTIADAHAHVVLDAGGALLQDLGSRNGTWVGDAAIRRHTRLAPGSEFRVGASRLRVVAPPPAPAGRPNPDAKGQVRVRRPPRIGTAPPPPFPAVPARAEVEPPSTTVGAASLVIPLVLGAALGLLLAPMFALFALLGPAMAGGQWLDDRRRHRRGLRRAEARFVAELGSFDVALRTWRSASRRRAEAATPDPATLVGWVSSGDDRCWQRRAGDEDHLRLRLGTGPAPLPPPRPGAAPAPEVAELLRHGPGAELPVALDLTPGEVLAVAGPADRAAAVVRSLMLQAAVLHAPADLAVAMVRDDPPAGAAVAWLPHARHGGRELVTTAGGAAAVLAARPSRPLIVFLDVDDPDLLLRDGSRWRDAACVVRVPEGGTVPSGATWVLELAATTPTGVLRSADRSTGRPLVVDGVAVGVLDATARVLARWQDATGGHEAVPDQLALTELLGDRGSLPAAIVERWRSGDHRPAAPLGRSADGPVVLDLSVDGPHALVAGTTGSGKSELLLSLVLGLAASCPPERLGFLLLDFKGGSTFDLCRRLPHTTDVLTDLDGDAAGRALRCLQAEVRRREAVLRGDGHRDVAAQHRSPDAPPLPWLVVVVDEFAVLAEEHPAVLEALVDVARRGRSLGLHLVLATQRPAGVVTDDIRANTAIRIALRVEDPADAHDVVGTGTPASFPRSAPGRALLRTGSGAPAIVQAASAHLDAGGTLVRELTSADGDGRSATRDTDAVTAVVTACRTAAEATGASPASSPLPPALPDTLDVAELPTATLDAVPIGLVDRPRLQVRESLWWRPADGPLVAVGGDAWAPARAAALTLVHGLCARTAHLQVLAVGRALDDLGTLPHVGSVVHAGEHDRLERLLHHLAGAGTAPHTARFLLVDDLPGHLRRLEGTADLPLRERLEELLLEGHLRGVHVVAGVPVAGSAPTHLLPPGTLLLVGPGVDRHDAAALGVGAAPPPGAAGSGRMTAGPDGETLQLVTGPTPPRDGNGTTGTRPPVLAAEAPVRAGHPFHSLPTPHTLRLDDELLSASDLGGQRWSVAIGRRHVDLAPARLELPPGGRALVAGPARSGRSTLLATIAAVVGHHRPDVAVTLVAPRTPPSLDAVGVDVVPSVSAAVEAAAPAHAGGPHLLLVDDADDLPDDDRLRALLEDRSRDLRVVAAGRTDRLRSRYGGWLTEVRRDRAGVALRPNPDLDGALWDTVLPRRHGGVTEPGRGELVGDGEVVRILVARP